MLPVVADPRIKPAARLGERLVSFLCGLTSVMKRLPEVGDLCRSAALQRGVDLPGIAAGKHDQQAPAHVAKIHYTSRSTFMFWSSVAVNA